MNSLLYEIYRGSYDIGLKRDKTQQELEKKLNVQWDIVQNKLGEEFVDYLLELEGEREDWRAFHYYREGYRAGARLMLEIFTSATG